MIASASKMAGPLEQILAKLLIPDNTLIQEATLELKEAFKNSDIHISLCRTVCSSGNPEVRQYAAVLLRRKILKRKQWLQIPENLRDDVKRMIMERLLVDDEKLVRTAVAQLCGTVAKHEFHNGSWPEIMQFIDEYVKSADPKARELAMFTLNAIASSASVQLRPHFTSLFNLFSLTLQDNENKMVIIYTIRALTNLVFLVDANDKLAVQNLIPRIIFLMKEFLLHDEEYSCEMLDFFDELVEADVSILVPHIKSVVEVCLEIARNQNLQQSTQIKAMNFISWLTQFKKKAILKQGLIVPILSALFPIMCRIINEDDEHDDVEEILSSEGSSPGICAAQVVDVMALHLPPEKLMMPLLELVEPALQSENPYTKKAAYVAIAVVSEGCAEFIRSKYLHPFLQSVCKGITDPNPVVKNAAFFTLGQFSEYLQPEISRYASELLPLLIEYLIQMCHQLQQDDRQPPGGMARMFYAIEMFCENLDNGILPYLPTLMERLMIILTTVKMASAKLLAISAIGATALAAKEEMLPYFQPIINHLKYYLTDNQSSENMQLQVQAMEALGILARSIGVKNFTPICGECMQLGLDLINKVDDPDQKRCIYGLFSSLAYVLKQDMAPYLPQIIPHMIASLQSSEGLVTHYKSDNSQFRIFDFDEDAENEGDNEMEEDGDGEDDDDDEEDDVSGYTVENAYTNEKEDVCQALRDISEFVQEGFFPYMEECAEAVFKFLDYPSCQIRKNAIECLGQFCCTLHAVSIKDNATEIKNKLQILLDKLIPQITEIITGDLAREAVMGALEVEIELAKALKGTLLDNSQHLESITLSAFSVMLGDTACQDKEETDDDEFEAEYDSMLIEFAGEVIASLALAMPPERYNPLFERFVALVTPKMKKNRTVPERSFAAGILAQSCDNMKAGVRPFVSRLLPLFLNAVRDEHEEVRANAIFGLGVLAEHGKELLFDQYPTILQVLSAALARETCGRPTDNICGAVARLIMTNVNGIPMDQVFPVMVKCLPLKEDLEENQTIFDCFLYLLNSQHPELPKHFVEIFKICLYVLEDKQTTEGVQNAIAQMMQTIEQQYPQQLEMISTTLPEIVSVLRVATSSYI